MVINTKDNGKMVNNLEFVNLNIKMEKNLMEKYMKEKNMMKYLQNMEMLKNYKLQNKIYFKIDYLL